mgnify:CR=1 FL=1
MARKTAIKKDKYAGMSRFGREVLEGLEDVLNLVQGKPSEARVSYVYNGRLLCIRDMRDRLGLTAEEFAFAFNLNLKNIHNWEQGIRQPNGDSLVYLSLIDRNPYSVYQSLHGTLKDAASPKKLNRIVKKDFAEMRMHG